MNNSFQYISGRELIERWGVDLVKLWQINDKSLQAYKVDRKGPYARPPWEKHPSQIEGAIKINENVFLVPETPETAPQLLAGVFLVKEIDTFEKEHPEIIPQSLSNEEPGEPGNLALYKKKACQAMRAVGVVVKWQMTQSHKLTQKNLEDFMLKKFGGNDGIAGKTWNKIVWDALPDEIKNSGRGNPKEPMP